MSTKILPICELHHGARNEDWSSLLIVGVCVAALLASLLTDTSHEFFSFFYVCCSCFALQMSHFANVPAVVFVTKTFTEK